MPSQETHGKGFYLVREIFVVSKVIAKVGIEASF